MNYLAIARNTNIPEAYANGSDDEQVRSKFSYFLHSVFQSAREVVGNHGVAKVC